MVYQVIYLQHNAPERVLGYVTANNYRHALAMVRHNPKYYDYDGDRLNVKIPPEKPKGRVPMREEQMLLKLAREVLGESEEDIHWKMTDMAGGPDRAFRLMNLYTKAQQSASGNKFTLRKMPSVEEIFHDRAREDGYSEKAIRFYLQKVR